MKQSLLIIIFFFIIGGCSFKEEKSNELYLIPKDFEGSILVIFGIPNEPVLKKEGKYTVIPIELKNLIALEGTEIQQYGVYLTSTPYKEVDKTVTNKYYYVDENEHRSAINEQCVHLSRSGSFTGENRKEISFQSLQITNSECGESFFLDGADNYYTQLGEVENFWLNKLSE
ncbi:DUF6843 domain-containing protein [Peribacillus simplex]|uniref:DUF6843 domain-containing protein n=1 Tax=Peribacillus simplex TaxID=1478 RepID=UPI00119E3119|nr:hypothetical protein [Peribacillus simplex]